MQFKIHSGMLICAILKSKCKIHCSRGLRSCSQWFSGHSRAPSSGPAPGVPQGSRMLSADCPGPGPRRRCWARQPLGGLGLRFVTINPDPPRRNQGLPTPLPLTGMCLTASRHFQRMDCHTLAKEE